MSEYLDDLRKKYYLEKMAAEERDPSSFFGVSPTVKDKVLRALYNDDFEAEAEALKNISPVGIKDVYGSILNQIGSDFVGNEKKAREFLAKLPRDEGGKPIRFFDIDKVGKRLMTDGSKEKELDVAGYSFRKNGIPIIVGPTDKASTLLHEQAHAQDDDYDFTHPNPINAPTKDDPDYKKRKGLIDAMLSYGNHFQNAPLLERHALQNLISNAKDPSVIIPLYQGSPTVDTSGNTDPIYKEKLKNLMLAN